MGGCPKILVIKCKCCWWPQQPQFLFSFLSSSSCASIIILQIFRTTSFVEKFSRRGRIMLGRQEKNWRTEELEDELLTEEVRGSFFNKWVVFRKCARMVFTALASSIVLLLLFSYICTIGGIAILSGITYSVAGTHFTPFRGQELGES